MTILLILSGELGAEQAMLECIADTYHGAPTAVLGERSRKRELPLAPAPGFVLLNFRFSATRHWTVRKASLFLHLAAGSAPKHLRIGLAPEEWSETAPPTAVSVKALREFQVTVLPQGWMQVDLDSALLAPLMSGGGHGIVVRPAEAGPVRLHSRETVQYAAYIVLEGDARQ